MAMTLIEHGRSCLECAALGFALLNSLPSGRLSENVLYRGYVDGSALAADSFRHMEVAS
jgi:hypothetical protein